jgi:hypothetical protein
VRGWDNLPAFTGAAVHKATPRATTPETTKPTANGPTLGGEAWELTLSTPMGPQVMTAGILRNGATFSGTLSSPEMGTKDITGQISGNTLSWKLGLTKPVSITLSFEANVEGDQITGHAKLGMFGKAALTGKRIFSS